MPTHCCVPLCNQSGYVDKDGRKVSFHRFPIDKELKRKWIAAIRRDEGPLFKISNATKVCSLHFIESDYWNSVASGLRLLHQSAVPSVFAFCKPKPSRKPPCDRVECQIPKKMRRKRNNAGQEDLQADVHSENQAPSPDVIPESPSSRHGSPSKTPSPLKQVFPQNLPSPQKSSCGSCRCSATISNLQAQLAGSNDNELKLQAQLAACRDSEAQLRAQLAASRHELLQLKGKAEYVENKIYAQSQELNLLRNELTSAQRTIEKLKQESMPFGIEKFEESNDDIQFYTGLPDYSSIIALLDYLEPGKNGKNIKQQKARSRSQQSYEYGGRPRKLSVENQLFLVLMKLRLNVFHRHLGHLFCISTSTVSRIFSSWIDFMYLQLAALPLWLSRQAIDEGMPQAFKDYASTRVLLDATEIRCSVPTSFVTQTQLYSHYKSAHTLKGLIGVSPCGLVTFVSELFTGSTSDRECVIRSGFLDLEFDPGDSVMADKGFRIADLLQQKGVALNLPPFLRSSQFTSTEASKTQGIATLRIHVERRIQRIKAYHIFDRPLPISLAPLANQMWTVCAVLSNFQEPLLREVDDTDES